MAGRGLNDPVRAPTVSAPTAAGRGADDARSDREAEALARLYDVDLLEDPGDLDLYLAMAARADGPVLELAVGSGRLAVPVANAGHAVTGVDNDPWMLARARRMADEWLGAEADRVSLHEADVRTVRLPQAGGFGLAFLALNSLLVLETAGDQLAAVRAMAMHLRPGGLAVVDVWLPDADDLGRFDGRLTLQYVRRDPETGNLVTKLVAARHDHTNQSVELTNVYDEGRPGQPPVRWVRQDRLRLVSPDELRSLAEQAGLETQVIAGSDNLDPIGPASDRAILIAEKPRR